MKLHLPCSTIAVLLFCYSSFGQNTFPSSGSAGIGTTSPNASSLLEVRSTTKGLLVPRMTQAQRNAIASPATGLMIFQTDVAPTFYWYTGTGWKSVGGAGRDLANLVTTKINLDLVPVSNAALNLGSSSLAWKDLNIGGYVNVDGNRFVSNFPGTTSLNTFVGSNAGKAITIGNNNTAIGDKALFSNTSGNFNTAIGSQSLYSNISGRYNVAIGDTALVVNKTGSDNLALGAHSLRFNTAGYSNVAVGTRALHNNTAGNENIAIGDSALYKTDNVHNVAIGSKALYNNTGSSNVAVGYQALYANTDGAFNTALGYKAAVNNATVNNNATAIGSNAYANCSNCLVLGAVNGSNGASSDVRVAIGVSAPYDNTALDVQTTTLQTAVYASSGSAGGNGINAICNNNSTADYAVWGIASVGYAGVFSGNVTVSGTFSNPSDQKLKENIKRTDNMLGKVMQLKPSQYNYKAEYKKMNLPQGQQIGFVAQDIEKVFPQLVVKGVDKTLESGKIFEYKAVNYIGLIPVLTRAIQELAEQNDSLKNALADIRNDVRSIMKNTGQNTSSSQSASSQTIVLSSSSLLQNVPNPFVNSTTINYNLPSAYSTAKITITDKSGRILKVVILNGTYSGDIKVEAASLAAGTYQYVLTVDGKIVDTKKMVLQR